MVQGKAVSGKKKIEVVTKVCETYSTQQVTIESACTDAGITVRTLLNYCKENSIFSDLYKKAQDEHAKLYYKGIRELAKTALQKKLTGVTVEETVQEGEFVSNPKGGKGDKIFIPGKVKRTKKFIPPDTMAIIYTLNNQDPDNFKNINRTEVTGKNGGAIQLSDPALDNLSAEQLFFIKHNRKPRKGEL